MAQNFELKKRGKRYIIEANFKKINKIGNEFKYYIELSRFDDGMTYRELKKHWNMELNEVGAIFDKYYFNYFTTKKIGKKIIDELDVLVLMKKLVMV